MGIALRKMVPLGAVAVLGLAIAIGCGCTGAAGVAASYQYFVAPDDDDAWSAKIAVWQGRELAQRGGMRPAPAVASSAELPEPEAPVSDDLHVKYDVFRAQRRRALAREFAEWIQAQAHEHYRPDGPIDHWATLQETFQSNGEDCDGLELLTYYFLRDLGFGRSSVYRAIVYRRSDGQHHMVTLWFEDPEDPWVIDPTGVMASGMPRMSSLSDWVPLKVFSDEQDFTVRQSPYARTTAQLASD